uniref:FRIGIDA-like protein 5 isoform X2 n=1 Tax=Fragaria vesca subsp. vesca TaxID=101020 RepID=UPI0005C809F4|nr:PREDICTED: FRIGIDA-like protein 5 isoform X2 [Fragaria vesca subsp. vesca]
MMTEERFDPTRNRVRAGFRELGRLVKQMEGVELKLRCDSEAKAVEIEEGKKKLSCLELKFEEKNRELSAREKRIEELEGKGEDVKVRGERLKGLQELIVKCDDEVTLKRVRIDLLQKSMMECSNILEARERKIRECNVGFDLLKKSMEEWGCGVEMKERDVEGFVVKMELKGKEVESKIEELELIDKRVKDCVGDVELRVGQFEELEKSMQDGMQESVREGERNLDSARKAVEEREKVLELLGRKLERKEKELEEQANEVKLKESVVKSRIEELDSKDKIMNELLNDVQLKEKGLESFKESLQKDRKHLDLLQESTAEREQQLDSLQRSVQDRENSLLLKQTSVQERERNVDSLYHGLQRRERELEKQAKELESKQKQFDSQRRGKHLEPNPAARDANVVSSTSDQSRINMDGRSLQLVMNEQVEKIDSAGSLISDVLHASSDPAKLVLDAMEGFYSSDLDVENRDLDHLRVVRKSCILLLQQLKRMSPIINPQVREEAVKLAAVWDEKMADTADDDDNSWGALGFLLLITTYELTSNYHLRELRMLLDMVSQPEQVAELSRALGITDKAPVMNAVSSIVKSEPSESSLARNEAILSPPNNNTQNERIVSLSSIAKIKKNLLVALQSSSDPAKLALDMMQRSFTYYWSHRDVSSKEKVVSSNISLLKTLMGLSIHVGPHLKENATNLASQWRAQLIADAEDSLESLGYLLFIAMYGLVATLPEDEIIMLLRRVSQHRQSLLLCQTHPFADYIPDFIQMLIEKKLLIEAVKSICAFKLNDKLPPVPLLREYVEDVMMSEVICRSQMTPDEKDKAVIGKIAKLRAAIQCMKDYNLESEYSKTVEIQIVQLEMLKEKWRSLAPKVEQEERKRKNPCASSSAPKSQPGKVSKIKIIFSGSKH